MGDESLPGRFAAAQQLYGAIDNTSLAGSDPALQAQIAAALGGFEGVSDMARALSLFSSNEDLDDVATHHLKYLLVDYYVGRLLLKVLPAADSGGASAAGHAVCITSLKKADMHLASFRASLEELGLDADVDVAEDDGTGTLRGVGGALGGVLYAQRP